MIPGIELLYRQIAESLQEAIPEEWSTAKFEAIFYTDGSTYEAEYIRTADGVTRGFQPAAGGARVLFGNFGRNSRRQASRFGVEQASYCTRMVDSTCNGDTTTAMKTATPDSIRRRK